MSAPKLEKIIKIMEKGKDFELTNEQYKTKTGLDIPKGKNYVEKRSAVAQRAKEHGFLIEYTPAEIKFRKNDKK